MHLLMSALQEALQLTAAGLPAIPARRRRGRSGCGEPVIFDPASYYGDRETDLAMMSLFGQAWLARCTRMAGRLAA